ncbi:MAG: YXWGXW repeat-containing protein [Geobacter sp.]|nr:YXWGXW repeat-containing protein [Geobacter sp.]
MREQGKSGIDRFRIGCRKSIQFRLLRRIAASIAICSAATLLLAFLVVAAPTPSHAQVSVGISVSIVPPALPIYVQPICPGPGYIWTPGYWAWDPVFFYFWVPGTWVLAPFPGWYWTPGYWWWYNGGYVWYEGYWGPVVGFYGGINYGFGYNGYGYYGGYWRGDTFYYNRTVNNVSSTTVTNVYSKPVPRSATTTRVSYNGGRGGTTLRPTATQQAAREKSRAPIAAQKEHVQTAKGDPKLRASVNKGRPDIAATPKPGAFKDPGVVRANKAGAPYKAPPSGREAPGGGVEKPGRMEKREPGAAPKREAPSKLKREAPSTPEREAPSRLKREAPPERMERPTPRKELERPETRPIEPRREQPRPERMERPQMEPRRAPESPKMAPQPSAPRVAPQKKEMPQQMPGGGKELKEGGPR